MMAEPLAKMRVLNPSRILDEPTVSQFLGNTEAENLSIKNPYANGNDIRCWGSPFDGHKDGKGVMIGPEKFKTGDFRRPDWMTQQLGLSTSFPMRWPAAISPSGSNSRSSSARVHTGDGRTASVNRKSLLRTFCRKMGANL